MLLLTCVAAFGAPLSGLLDVQLTNRYLKLVIETSTSATYLIAYGVVSMLASGAGLLSLVLRQRPRAAADEGDADQ